jgi:hypothetical protein
VRKDGIPGRNVVRYSKGSLRLGIKAGEYIRVLGVDPDPAVGRPELEQRIAFEIVARDMKMLDPKNEQPANAQRQASQRPEKRAVSAKQQTEITDDGYSVLRNHKRRANQSKQSERSSTIGPPLEVTNAIADRVRTLKPEWPVSVEYLGYIEIRGDRRSRRCGDKLERLIQ